METKAKARLMGWLGGAIALGLVVAAGSARADDDGWISLIDDDGFATWTSPTLDWSHTKAVKLDPKEPKRFAFEPGPGPILVNGALGRTRNLTTRRSFGDVEARFEFVVPKGSNSGVKFEGLYEIQISDSHDVARPGGSDSGGIYPRAELLPRYHHIDDGTPPRVNAARPAGEWQTLDVVFKAPRFDASGKKVACAKIVKAVLNGQVVHEDVELATPTGHAHRMKETPTGPLLIQADHGPVAFRNVRVRPLSATPEP